MSEAGVCAPFRLRDSWLVLPLLLLGVPIVAPAGLLVIVSLLAFYLVEHLFYLPLKIAAALRARPTGRGGKEVNLPELSLRQT